MKHRNSIILTQDEILEACEEYLQMMDIVLPDQCSANIIFDEKTKDLFDAMCFVAYTNRYYKELDKLKK